ncbi:MAG: ABC transporter permease [Oscillospiraceae bacterium]|nr:ABC transporter permease [Oscillospiraceae bacterium]
MKFFQIFLEFYRKNILAAIVLIVILTISLFSVMSAAVQYNYLSYAKTFYTHAGLENSVYVMPKFTTQTEKLLQQADHLRNQEGVEAVLTQKTAGAQYGGEFQNLYFYNQAEQKMPVHLSAGTNFQQAKAAPQGTRNAIVSSGGAFQTIKCGDTLQLFAGSTDGKECPLSIHVIGKLAAPQLLPDFGTASYGTALPFDQLLTNATNAVILQDDATTKTLQKQLSVIASPCYFLSFRSDASAAQKDAVFSTVESTGAYISYQTLLNDTKIQLHTKMQKLFGLPVFFLVVSTVAFLSVSVLLVTKKLKDHIIYYLCGCSKRRSRLFILTNILSISLIPCLLNGLLLFRAPALQQVGLFPVEHAVVYPSLFFLLLGYLVLSVFLSVAIPFSQLRNETLTQLNRGRI